MRIIAASLAALALAGCSAVSQGPSPATTTPLPAARGPQLSPVPRAAPAFIDIPAISAHSSLITVGLDDTPQHAMQVPDVATPQQAAWYCNHPQLAGQLVNCDGGVVPGQVGPAVVVGHVDGSPASVNGPHQQGIFFRLHELQPGDAIKVTLVEGTVLTFVVYKVASVPKDQFSIPAAYGNTQTPELRVITCGGPWKDSETGYANNILVSAVMTESHHE